MQTSLFSRAEEYDIIFFFFFSDTEHVTTMKTHLATLICMVTLLDRVSSNVLVQNPVVSCNDEKRKLLCLPTEYSKFDLPYRNDFNIIDIGKNLITCGKKDATDTLKVGPQTTLSPKGRCFCDSNVYFTA